MSSSRYQTYKKIFLENNGILRFSNATKLGIPRHAIDNLVRTGEIVKEARGLYRLRDLEPLGNPDLVQVSILIPRSVVCLISALYFFDLTTQIPHRVSIALQQDIKTPAIEYPPLRVFHFSKQSFMAGIEEHVVDGTKVRIYGKEKTIADCFKFRRKIGTAIAVEALRDYMRQPNPDIGSIMKYSRTNRVEHIIRPYIEALV